MRRCSCRPIEWPGCSGAGRAVSSSRSLRGASPGPTDGPHLAGAATSAEELVLAVGLEPRDDHARRHLEPLHDLSRLRIDAPDVALLTFPGPVPELAVDPGDARDEAVRFDGAQDRPRLGIDLVDLSLSILSDPKRALAPREAGVAPAAGRRNRGEHTTGLGIDLLNTIL